MIGHNNKKKTSVPSNNPLSHISQSSLTVRFLNYPLFWGLYSVYLKRGKYYQKKGKELLCRWLDTTENIPLGDGGQDGSGFELIIRPHFPSLWDLLTSPSQTPTKHNPFINTNDKCPWVYHPPPLPLIMGYTYLAVPNIVQPPWVTALFGIISPPWTKDIWTTRKLEQRIKDDFDVPW